MSDSSNMNSGDTLQNEGDDFDTNLPTEHLYLGHMDNLHGYTLYDDGSEHEMLGVHTDTLVCPGHTLPLLLDYHQEIDIMKHYMANSKTFVLVCASTTDSIFCYGITMEIIEVSETDSMALKAKGRQRCKIIHQSTNLSFRMGKVRVRILPEVDQPGPLFNVRLPSLDKCRNIEVVEQEKCFLKMKLNEALKAQKRNRLRRYDACQLRWPLWVYDQYELNYLCKSIKQYLNAYSIGDCVPSDPVQLSYWFMQNFQLNHDERLEILKLDSAHQRLRLELYYLKLKRLLCCALCNTVVAKQSDVFAMSKDGIQSNYCNPGGHIYETLTVSDAVRISLVGHPSEQYSWFPGYAWTIAQCAQCNHHLGWLFTSKKLNPNKFWGLAKNSITIKIINNQTY